MSIDRARVRALVRAELEKRLNEPPPALVHAALLEIYQGPESGEDVHSAAQKPCIIEPDRPCTNSGYCKKLGH